MPRYYVGTGADMSRFYRYLWPLYFLIFCIFAFSLRAAEPAPSLPVVQVQIETQKGLISLSLEVAATPQTRARGLMQRTTIGPEDGMLFVFADATPQSFWMKNTWIPLDIIFFDGEGYVLRVAENVPPNRLDPIPSGGATGNVIELAAGRAKALGITEGDRLIYELPAGVFVE
jgi:uncharacterized membrane protein (UPF0127 family)